jgi:hypothetical protein
MSAPMGCKEHTAPSRLLELSRIDFSDVFDLLRSKDCAVPSSAVDKRVLYLMALHSMVSLVCVMLTLETCSCSSLLPSIDVLVVDQSIVSIVILPID